MRDAVAYVISNAKCGDVLIPAGLSLSEVDYYMKHLNAPSCLSIVAFLQTSKVIQGGWI